MSLIDEIVGSYGEPDGPQEFSITLPKGEVFTFRSVRDYSEIRKLALDGQKLAKAFKKGLVTPQLKAVAPSDDSVAAQAFMLAETSIEPKLTQYDVLRIAKGAGWLFAEIVRQYDAAQSKFASDTEVEETERLGESSIETSTGETSSSLPGTSGIDIPTS